MRRVRSIQLALTLVAFAPALAPALAAEGVLPIRAGDRVEGEVRWCGDRHILAVSLVRGETLRAKVRAAKTFNEDVTVRFFDPEGLAVNGAADIRAANENTLLGPFRVTHSGTHLLQITTFTRHELAYEVITKVKGRRKRSARLKEGRERALVAASGSLLQLRGLADEASVSIGFPGGTRTTFEPGSACLAALTGGGLTLPEGGAYAITVSAGRARLRVAAPRRTDGRTLEFPELPDDRTSVATWYDDTGWLADPHARAPADHEPPTSLPGTGPRPGASDATLRSAPAAPAAASARLVFEQAANPGGYLAGVGMPIAPMPSIEEALLLGRIEPFADGPSYVYDIARTGLGTVSYRVHFVVGGRASLAPASLGGSVTMRWHAEGGGAFHREDWALTFDDVRGVEVLDGSALYIGSGFTTIRSAAEGFALPTDGSSPYGEVSWGLESVRDGSFLRSETHSGTGAVNVVIR